MLCYKLTNLPFHVIMCLCIYACIYNNHVPSGKCVHIDSLYHFLVWSTAQFLLVTPAGRNHQHCHEIRLRFSTIRQVVGPLVISPLLGPFDQLLYLHIQHFAFAHTQNIHSHVTVCAFCAITVFIPLLHACSVIYRHTWFGNLSINSTCHFEADAENLYFV